MATCFQTITPAELNEKLRGIDIETATLADVVRLFGEPHRYLWGNQTFTREDLPPVYLAQYTDLFDALVQAPNVLELRFSTPAYRFRDAVQVGYTLDEILKALPAPRMVVQGVQNTFVSGVLYRDIGGVQGNHYYSVKELNLRLFFSKDKLGSLYVSRRTLFVSDDLAMVITLQKFDDVRRIAGALVPGGKDVSTMDLSGKADIIPTLTFNLKTVWPETARMPRDVNPVEILEQAMNPGLGLRSIHQEGLTGRGVSVAIIDQPMFLDHPEFAGKIAAYKDFETEMDNSMHGPAVTSILAGSNIGAAPEATVYYAAVPSWKQDTEYYARALDWILQQNRDLPPDSKIRVVSVSAAPSGQGTPYVSNVDMWDRMSDAAAEQGVLVLDCTAHRGLIWSCWHTGGDRDDPSNYAPGYPGLAFENGPLERLLAPTSPRSTAEQYSKDDPSYQYTGRGGLSWAIPYVAGVLALGWQERPELDYRQMFDLLQRSAYSGPSGTRIIQPAEFIRKVREFGR